MSDLQIERTGGCACGAVRFVARGEPLRVGLCHCMTCRKAHASAFNPFVIFRAEQVEITGEIRAWESSPGYRRWFCPACGSRIYGGDGTEYELSVGGFDEPGLFAPDYESWIVRREPWQPPLKVPQWRENREA